MSKVLSDKLEIVFKTTKDIFSDFEYLHEFKIHGKMFVLIEQETKTTSALEYENKLILIEKLGEIK